MNKASYLLFTAYFIAHIFITIFIDSQVLVPRDFYPKPVTDVVDWYLEELKDPLFAQKPAWFRSFVWCELLFQFPLVLLCAYAFVKKQNWIRIPALVYGCHVTTTMFPIYQDLWQGGWNITDSEKTVLTLIYLPYLLIPGYLTLYMALVDLPFGDQTRSTRNEKKKV